MNKKYLDIINLPHHVSKKHEKMSLELRAAQFAPFSALTGYKEIINETERYTDTRKQLNEEEKNMLDYKIQLIKKYIDLKKELILIFIYFIPDNKKNGGKYKEIIGKVTKIDEYNQLIILENKIEIPIKEIVEIKGEIFE